MTALNRIYDSLFLESRTGWFISATEIPKPVAARGKVRIEAENFEMLEGCRLEDRNDRAASHRLNVAMPGANDASGRMQMHFQQP